jgi:hypothetical protein
MVVGVRVYFLVWEAVVLRLDEGQEAAVWPRGCESRGIRRRWSGRGVVVVVGVATGAGIGALAGGCEHYCGAVFVSKGWLGHRGLRFGNKANNEES